jgi:Cu2+-exporting ATPase
MQRYYRLRQGPGARVTDVPKGDRDLSWLADGVRPGRSADQKHLRLDLQGIHCSGCVWILEKTFQQESGGHRLIVNPARGTADIWFGDDFPLERWVRAVERFGYRFGPALKTADRKVDALLIRLGICVAIAFNVGLLSLALYLGLEEGPLYGMVRWASFALASIALLVGGPVFFRSAWAGLRNRVLHLDVPISIGILLAFAGSTWAFWSGTDSAMYLDSVSVFIALMLLGRYLQQRVLNANRNRLLASDGTKSLRSRLLVDGAPVSISSEAIVQGNTLLIASGDLIAVDCRLLSPRAQISTDWVNGESSATLCRQGDRVQAGSFNAGKTPLRVSALHDFSSSPLELLLSPSPDKERGVHESGLVKAISGYYVALVLVAAAAGFGAWLWATHDLPLALEIATAVLIVTCPCALGIATPLAHEIVHSRLRTEGLFVRAGDFLDRATHINKVVFDKTGTVTTGATSLVADGALTALTAGERQALFELCAASTHPTSQVILQALADYPLQVECDELADDLEEVAGAGMRRFDGIAEYRLGKAEWACSEQGRDEKIAGSTVFTRDGKVLARFYVREEVRPDVHHEVAALQSQGLKVFLLSGDSDERVAELANSLGLPAEQAFAQHNPVEKQEWLAQHDQGDLLFIGDGINDSLAAQSATCSGTPALDRPFMASHCDFFLASDRIEPVRSALRYAKKLSAVVRRNLVFALAYNGIAIAMAWAGWMSPWLAAILMPASSILIVTATTFSLSRRSLQWKS